MTMKKTLKQEPDHNMIEAAYTIYDAMPSGTPARSKRAVAEIWRAMWEAAPRPSTGGLLRRQLAVQEFIADYISEHGQAPSLREIAELECVCRKPDAFKILRQLERKGVVRVRKREVRGIDLLIPPGEPLPSGDRSRVQCKDPEDRHSAAKG